MIWLMFWYVFFITTEYVTGTDDYSFQLPNRKTFKFVLAEFINSLHLSGPYGTISSIINVFELRQNTKPSSTEKCNFRVELISWSWNKIYPFTDKLTLRSLEMCRGKSTIKVQEQDYNNKSNASLNLSKHENSFENLCTQVILVWYIESFELFIYVLVIVAIYL